MSNPWDWQDDDEEVEFQAAMRRMDQEFAESHAQAQTAQAQQAAAAQAEQAMRQAASNAAVFGSGQIQSQTGLTGDVIFTQASLGGSGQAWGRSFNTRYNWETPQRHPQQDAHDFVNSLNYLTVNMVKEIILLEPLYMQIVALLHLDLEKQPDAIKELTYNISNGIVLLKNEKYQFNLDKYLIEGDPVEV